MKVFSKNIYFTIFFKNFRAYKLLLIFHFEPNYYLTLFEYEPRRAQIKDDLQKPIGMCCLERSPTLCYVFFLVLFLFKKIIKVIYNIKQVHILFIQNIVFFFKYNFFF